MQEEQQVFRINSPTINAIFIAKQISETSLLFNKSSYMYFVDIAKDFDKGHFKNNKTKD